MDILGRISRLNILLEWYEEITMTQKTFIKTYLIGTGYSFRSLVQCHYGRKMKVNRQICYWKVAESCISRYTGSRKRKTLGLAWVFETCKPGDSLPPSRPHLLILSNSVTAWWPSIETYDLWKPVSLKPLQVSTHSLLPSSFSLSMLWPLWKKLQSL